MPQFCPTARELDDLELLVTGALSPTTAFNEPGSPVTLTLPPDVGAAAAAAGGVELVDPEGLPLARVAVPGGQVEALTHAQFGPFRRLYLSPAAVRASYAGRTFVPVTDALTLSQLDALRAAGPVVLLALVGHGTPLLSPVALLRATLRAADLLDDAVVVAVPLAARGDAAVDHELGLQVVANYAGTDPVLGLSDDDGELPAGVAEVVERDQPPADRQGLVLFFTGLSGSGKSTLARALMDRLLEEGTRTVTSLDGDVVRRNLSAGLSFSKADRETNIRRIGWVAAEISRHGGVAVCSPIAPFDETRQQVRAMVDEAGGAFFLVHVATPLEECERRDRKGLYAKARRGEIPEFTGISSPYEVPADADVVVDTTGRTIDAALADVLAALRTSGHLDLTAPGVEPVETPAEHLKVLFVCTANICRSPFMERLARHLAGPDATVTFTSAGTHGFAEHAMDDVMATTLGPRGVVDHDTFHSRPLTRELLDEHDLVLTAEASHRAFILDDHPGLFRKVFTLGQFDEAVRTVGAGLTGRKLLMAVAEQRGTASADLDVADPYRRGPEAAEAAATAIEAHLRHIVPALTGAEPHA
ncbi:adenylyl-sulfate kinase [Nocardioides sp. dk4132]|nr:adenylyl-sulfate kinase [Nocardioides sp. dk4132]QGA09823.1 adenylyl-sulfate kinase [Nocardioides sp. dk884]